MCPTVSILTSQVITHPGVLVVLVSRFSIFKSDIFGINLSICMRNASVSSFCSSRVSVPRSGWNKAVTPGVVLAAWRGQGAPEGQAAAHPGTNSGSAT